MNETGEAKPYPMDFDAMEKGDVISVAELERITGLKSGTSAYDFAVLKLRGLIQCEQQARGRYVVIASHKGTLRILLDKEATTYLDTTRRHLCGRLGRAHRQLTAVDTAGFSQDELVDHTHNVIRSASLISHMIAARHDAKKLINHGGVQLPFSHESFIKKIADLSDRNKE